ncbi:MAG: hypothetical protein J6S20_03050 [Paludibacteraceae bacterium]|jgi:predicted  nucleic acid-binding Zn-ribbon protein|nr:hypothetical protein [Paludibacteraceae bacterium]
MDNQRQKIFEEFEGDFRLLMKKYNELREKLEETERKLNEKNEDLMAAHKEVLEWRKNYSRLQMAKSLSVTKEERDIAYRKISNLMRKIDNCLVLLNE